MEIFERPCDSPGVTLLDLDGGLDHTTTDEFIRRMDTLLEKGSPRVVLDLEHLSYASSWGLAALVRVHHHYALRGGRIAFARLHSAVATILRISRLDETFDLYPTISEAVRGIMRPADDAAPPPPGPA
jgi:anti-anti-sigma factor